MKKMVTGSITVIAIAGFAWGLAQAQDAGADPMGGPGERPTFEALDQDGNGGITLEELNARSATRFAGTDADGDGKLSAEEMTAAMIARVTERAAAGSARMIERRDTDGDGMLSQAELAGDQGERLFKRLDADADGVVTAEEFAAIRELGKMGRQRHGEGQKSDGGRG